MPLQAKSPSSRHAEIRQRIGFDTSEMNSITESELMTHSPSSYNTPEPVLSQHGSNT